MELLPISNYLLTRLVNPTIHVDDQLILKSKVCVGKERVEIFLERAKERL